MFDLKFNKTIIKEMFYCLMVIIKVAVKKKCNFCDCLCDYH